MEGEEESSVDTRGGLSAKVNNAGSRTIGPSIFFAQPFLPGQGRLGWEIGSLIPDFKGRTLF